MHCFRSKLLFSSGLLLSSLAAQQALAQLAVFDAPNQVHLVATVSTLRAELAQIQTLSALLNGARHWDPSLDRLTSGTIWPSSVDSLYGASTALQGPSLSQRPCVARNAAMSSLCQLDAQDALIQQQWVSNLYAESAPHADALNALQGAAAASTDLKSSTDLGARASAATATLEHQRLQVELLALEATLQTAALAKARRADQLGRVVTAQRAVDSLVPLTFAISPP